jgi:hypothetical protein
VLAARIEEGVPSNKRDAMRSEGTGSFSLIETRLGGSLLDCPAFPVAHSLKARSVLGVNLDFCRSEPEFFSHPIDAVVRTGFKELSQINPWCQRKI